MAAVDFEGAAIATTESFVVELINSPQSKKNAQAPNGALFNRALNMIGR